MDSLAEKEALILRKRRMELGISQMQVAVEADIYTQQYQRFESGKKRISNASLLMGLRVCKALDLDPYLFFVVRDD